MAEEILIGSSPLSVHSDTSVTECNSDSSNYDGNNISLVRRRPIDISLSSDSDNDLPESQLSKVSRKIPKTSVEQGSVQLNSELSVGDAQETTENLLPEVIALESDSNDQEICEIPLIVEHFVLEKAKGTYQQNCPESVTCIDGDNDLLKPQSSTSKHELNAPLTGSNSFVSSHNVKRDFLQPLESDSDSDYFAEIPLYERLKRLLPENSLKSVGAVNELPRKRLATHKLSDSSSDETEQQERCGLLPNDCNNSDLNKNEIAAVTVDKQLAKASKIRRANAETEKRNEIRREKKLEKEREKLLKNIEKETVKMKKPGESIKYMKINMDRTLIEDPETNIIPTLLDVNNLQYSVVTFAVKGCITWSREVTEKLVLDNFQLQQNKHEVNEHEALIFLKFPEFLEKVYVFKQKQQGLVLSGNTFLQYVQTVQQLLPEFKLTFVIMGTDKYFRNKKNSSNRLYKAAVRGGQHHLKKNKDLEISKIDMEEAMLDVQLRMRVNVKLIERFEDLGTLLSMYTKAIAEAPHKRELHDQKGLSWYARADGVGTVKVQKEGPSRLWQQQLMQFHQVSRDTAVAIVTAYPSPQALLQAYRKCTNVKEAENLLSNIQVRRGIGPLTTNRRVGPELSYKIFTLFSSLDGDSYLHRK